MEVIMRCPCCLRVREALGSLMFQLGAESPLVELRDGGLPFDLDDAVVSCAKCHDTGHVLTAEGEQLLGVLVARLKAIASGQARQEEPANG